MKNRISIKVLSDTCGVVPHTIRTWETRYQAFTPTRSPGGQRLYSEDDLSRAKLIVFLVEHGFGISKVAKLSRIELQEQVDLITENKRVSIRENSFAASSIKNLFLGLESFKIDQVAQEFDHIRLSVGVKEFIFEIILPVMQRIGVLVAQGKYSVTQEHIVSTIVRFQLGQIKLPNLGLERERVALATPDGNMHELAIIIADVLCRANRVSTVYLGASHPADCLGQAVNALKCNTITLGAVSSDKWDYKKNMIPYLKELDKHLDHKVKVVLGGASSLKFPTFKNIEKVEIIRDFEIFDQELEKGRIQYGKASA